MIENDVAAYLEDNAIGTVSEDIFVGRMPDTPANAVVVINTNGQTPSKYVSDLRFPTFQIIVRDESYEDGATKAKEIRDLLHGKYGLEWDSGYIMRIHAQQEPGHIGVDTIGRDEFSCNYYAESRPTS